MTRTYLDCAIGGLGTRIGLHSIVRVYNSVGRKHTKTQRMRDLLFCSCNMHTNNWQIAWGPMACCDSRMFDSSRAR